MKKSKKKLDNDKNLKEKETYLMSKIFKICYISAFALMSYNAKAVILSKINPPITSCNFALFL
jgi:hypothetical protein